MRRALITATIFSIIVMPAFAQSAADNWSRSEALEKCNAEANKWSSRDYQTTNLTVYRNCMIEHGQPFE